MTWRIRCFELSIFYYFNYEKIDISVMLEESNIIAVNHNLSRVGWKLPF